MADCRECGQRAGNNRRKCRECTLEDRYGVPADYFETANEVDVDDESQYRCTKCQTRYAGSKPCPDCDANRRRYIGPMSDSRVIETEYGQASDDVIAQIRGTWSRDDPLVLAFDDVVAGDPVVGDVDGELRFLSKRLVFPAGTDEREVRDAIDEYGTPSIEHLSTFEDRFHRTQFEWDRPKAITDCGQLIITEGPGRSLQSDAHYCDNCERPFQSLKAFVNHVCYPSDTDHPVHRAACTDCSWSEESADPVEVTDAMERHSRKEVGHDVNFERSIASDGGAQVYAPNQVNDQ